MTDDERLETPLRPPSFAMLLLEDVIDETYRRIQQAADDDAFVRLANSLAMATTRLVNGHRLLAVLSGEVTPLQAALKGLAELKFDED